MMLLLPILYNTAKTEENDLINKGSTLQDYEQNMVLFMNIDNVRPYMGDITGSTISSGGSDYICAYSVEKIARILASKQYDVCLT